MDGNPGNPPSVSYGFDSYRSERDAGHEFLETDGADPVDVLRQCWDNHVEFGLNQPELYVLMYGAGQDPPARKEAYQKLLEMMGHVAASGCLRAPPRSPPA